MDVIITAIILGFIVWFPVKFIRDVLKNYKAYKKNEIEAYIKKTHVFVRIEEVDLPKEEKLFLIFNAETGKFITQGSIPEIKSFLNSKYKAKNVYLAAEDGSIVPLKPAEIQ